MAEAANPTAESYAHSLSTIRNLGRVLLHATVESPERAQVEELAFADYETAVVEMLKTDAEFRDQLDVDTKRTHEIVGGRVLAADGIAMVTILERGARASRQAARFDSKLEAQATRDACDVSNAQRVDDLKPGMTLWGISMEPKQELQRFKETYAGLGYREGLAYIQSYTKVDERTLIARSYSVDTSDEAMWRDVLADHGMPIPEGESLNKWLAHAVELQADDQQAEDFVTKLRAEYYRRRGVNHERSSVTQYAAANEAIIRGFFKVYYHALSKASVTDKNNQTLKDFAGTLLQADIAKLKPEIRQQLIRITNSDKFDAESGRVVDSLIRYAVVEELRKGLPAHLDSKPVDNRSKQYWQRVGREHGMDPHELNRLMANNVERGIAAGRSYGGCAGNIELSNREASNSALDGSSSERAALNQQEAYGGRATSSEGVGKISMGECVVRTCPTRPGRVLVGGCGVCLGRCQKLFDKGADPTKMMTLSILFEPKTEATNIISLKDKRSEKRGKQERTIGAMAQQENELAFAA